jgi:hypothetical protein
MSIALTSRWWSCVGRMLCCRASFPTEVLLSCLLVVGWSLLCHLGMLGGSCPPQLRSFMVVSSHARSLSSLDGILGGSALLSAGSVLRLAFRAIRLGVLCCCLVFVRGHARF